MRPGTALLLRCAPPRRPLAAVLGWSVVEAVPALVSGLALAHAVDAFRGGDLGRAFAWLAAPAVAIAVGAWASTRLYGVLAVVVEDVRDNLSTAVLDGELGRIALGGRSAGAPFAQLTDQIDQVRGLLSALLRSLRSTASPLIAAVAGLLLLDGRLAASVVTPVTISLLLYALLLPRTVGRSRDSAVAEEELGREVADLFGALPQIRGLGVSRWAADRLTRRTDDAAAAEVRLIRTQAVRRLVVALGAHGPLIGVLLVGAAGLHAGRVSVGDLVGATTYVLAVSAPALRALFGSSGGWLVQLLVLLDRLAVVAAPANGDPDLRSTHRHDGGRRHDGGTRHDGGRRHDGDAPGDASPEGDAIVVVDELSFAYRPKVPPVISALDFRLKPGHLLAVAGPSGAGKSTLARLLAGLVTPIAGRVSLRADVRVCLVPQEPYVFAGTLRENLTYLAPAPVADERLRACADLFGLDLEADPNDLDAARRQLVVLARAYLSEAELVILDEATCHLDAEAERAAEAVFRDDRRTLIVIAHRLDVTARADQVLWLDGVTQHLGTRADLIAGCPPFRDLVSPSRSS